MRWLSFSAAIFVIAFVAFAGRGLSGALAQLRGMAVQPEPAAVRSTAPAPSAASAALDTQAALVIDRGEESIRRLLAEDPAFVRAADELMNDPDPLVRLAGAQLLHELGMDAPSPAAGR